MNKRIHVFYGLLLGLLLSFIGTYLYILLFTDFDPKEAVSIAKDQGNFGKLMVLGATPNLIAFFGLLKFNKEMWARGIVLSVLAVAITSIFYL